MTSDGMNVRDIQRALYWRALGSSRRYMAPNVHLLVGEQDWVEVTQSGFAYEYEIKMSRSDLQADMRKKVTKWVRGSGRWNCETFAKHDALRQPVSGVVVPARFYFVYPEGMCDEDLVPDYTGIITARWCEERKEAVLRTRRTAPRIKHATRLEAKHYKKLLRSLTHRCMEQLLGRGAI